MTNPCRPEQIGHHPRSTRLHQTQIPPTALKIIGGALRFPFRGHQVIPPTAQRLPDSRHRGNQDIDFARFYSSNSSSIDVRQFSQPLLGHFQRGANAPDMVSHFPKFGRQLDNFGHTTLAEFFGVDIKGVVRPNLKSVWEPLAEIGR